jgi:hypothetical protein
MTAASSARPPTDPNGGSGNGPPHGQHHSIDVHREGSTIVITVRDRLDAAAGRSLVQDATSAITAKGIGRLDIDLRALESFTSKGARALVVCRALGAGLAEGLHYRTGRGPGRDALLAAYRELETEMRG